MGKYRKKPVVIEAIQWDGTMEGCQTIEAAFPEMMLSSRVTSPNGSVVGWSIRTLEGSHGVSTGDFIIKGVKGEFYPCKPDVFALTYEEVME